MLTLLPPSDLGWYLDNAQIPILFYNSKQPVSNWFYSVLTDFHNSMIEFNHSLAYYPDFYSKTIFNIIATYELWLIIFTIRVYCTKLHLEVSTLVILLIFIK